MIRSVLVVGMMVLIAACHAPQQEEASDTTTANARSDTASDTLPRSAVDPGPAPGTARVRATVQDCQQHAASGVQCQLEIREVVAYGSATPVLETGTSVEVRVPDERALQWDEEQSREVEVTLSHTKQSALDEASGSTWRLEAIHEE